MQAIVCETCRKLVAPGDYGSKQIATAPLHSGARETAGFAALTTVGECHGSLMDGPVVDVDEARAEAAQAVRRRRYWRAKGRKDVHAHR